MLIHNVEHAYPKEVFQECFRAQLITQEEAIIALNMVDYRSETSHAYNEGIADEVARAIPKYCLIMQKLLRQTQPL